MASWCCKIGFGVLSLIALVVMSFLLSIVIRGNLIRFDETNKISKLIVLTDSTSRLDATGDANFLRARYAQFLSMEVDIDLAFMDTKSNDTLLQMLADLKPVIFGGDQSVKIVPFYVNSDQILTDKLFEWLSAEGTEEDAENSETIVKQFDLMTLPGSKIDFVLSRLGVPSVGSGHMLIVEAMPEKVTIGYVATNEDEFTPLRNFGSLEATRKKLCPKSTSFDLSCHTDEKLP